MKASELVGRFLDPHESRSIPWLPEGAGYSADYRTGSSGGPRKVSMAAHAAPWVKGPRRRVHPSLSSWRTEAWRQVASQECCK